MNYVFGAKWDAPICDELPMWEGEVPETCFACLEKLVEGDNGVMQPYVHEGGTEWVAIHKECNLRNVLGSPDHLDGNCSCYGESGKSKRTYREEALEVWRRVTSGSDLILDPDGLAKLRGSRD